jgi:predicted Fe-Mo cluster-binding NifX family protein
MKIAVASSNNSVAQHFGHCEGFYVFEEERGKVIDTKFYQNPGHKPGILPKYLADLEVTTIIAGGMGGAAIDLFNGNNIEVIVGASGDVEGIVKEYLGGNLKSTGSICREHEHSDDC